MNWLNLLDDPQVQELIFLLFVAILILIVAIGIFKRVKKSNRIQEDKRKETAKLKDDNLKLSNEVRERTIDHLNMLSRLILLNPVIPGNTPESNTLEGRNRAKCLAMILEGLPKDVKGHGIRMAEFIHHLSDNLVQAYGREGIVHLLIDSHPIILEVDTAAHVGLMFNELISNALQYAPEPGAKSKVNINFKERDNKLFITVGDNGTGMKSPYLPKFSFGLQLTNSLVQKHKGEMIISSRPGTRVEIILQEYQKAEREVFVTPTTKVY